MKQAMLFNLVGTALIAFAIILHIICLATPYYSEADMNNFGQKVADYVKKEHSLHQNSADIDEAVQEAMQGLGQMQGTINFGMWKLCLSAGQGQGSKLEMCMSWGADTSYDPSTGVTETLSTSGWIRGVQAMAIIGVLLAGGAGVMSVINLVSPSKGDRLRLIHIFICAACVAAGVFVLIGDIIMAVNYKSIFEVLMQQNQSPPPQGILDIFTDQFYLSWGFALDIVAVALAFLSGIAHLMGGRVALNENGLI